jgi:probable addiction module antidote protein
LISDGNCRGKLSSNRYDPDSDPDAFLAAVSDVAKARGMTDVAAHAGLGRESLYKALRPGARPRFDTVRRLLTALGVRLDVVATAQRR